MHLVQRGINREPCFFAEEDYHCFLHWLQKSAADWDCAIHAYVLMTNHIHLLITAERPDGPARLMQSLGRRYVQYINRAYKRSGSLWEGRYKSSAGQAEERLTPHPLYQSLGREAEARLASYRALFRSELDNEAISDIRLALAQSQPLGDDRFAERTCAKVGVRHDKPKRGRPPRKEQSASGIEGQTEFGF